MECEWVMKIKMSYGMWMSYENKNELCNVNELWK